MSCSPEHFLNPLRSCFQACPQNCGLKKFLYNYSIGFDILTSMWVSLKISVDCFCLNFRHAKISKGKSKFYIGNRKKKTQNNEE